MKNINNIKYVPKRPLLVNADVAEWREFGAPSESEWKLWLPEVCGICCLKMIGDTLGVTNIISLYELTQRCLRLGGFKVQAGKSIQGVYHAPLLELGRTLGLEGKVEKGLDIEQIASEVDSGHFVILSIDLQRANTGYCGGHLVLIHSVDRGNRSFSLHDPSSVLSIPGYNIEFSYEKLDRISNKKGLSLWAMA